MSKNFLKRKNKAIKAFIITALVASSMQPFYAESIEGGPKTSINDLLNTSETLISPVDIPRLDMAGSKLLINGDTGQILYSEDGEYPLPIYSVTKVLAAYVILDKLKENKPDFTLDTRIVAEGRPVLVSYEYGFSNLSLIEGQEYTVRELLDSVMIHSANASTMLLAQYIAGGEQQFVELMRVKAAELGLKQTSVYSSTGLDKADLVAHGYEELEDGVNHMSAVDVAFMTMQFMQDYPTIVETTKKTSAMFGELTDEPYEYDSTVAILPGNEFGYEGVTGLKTGGDIFDYTASIVFTAVRGDVNLIGVIIGSRNTDIRNVEAIDLLDFGFNTLDHTKVIDEQTILFEKGTVKTKYTLDRKVPVTVEKPLILSHSKVDEFKTNVKFIPTNSKYNSKKNAFNGPIRKGEVLGKLVVNYEDLSFITDKTNQEYSVNVIATEDSKDGFVIFNMFEWIADKVSSNFKFTENN